jgi:hypothetical protein
VHRPRGRGQIGGAAVGDRAQHGVGLLGGEAQGVVLLQQALDDRPQRAGLGGRLGGLGHERGERGGDRAAFVRGPPLDREVEGGAERPQVRLGPGVLAARPLRRGVARGPDHHAGLGEVAVAGRLGDAEVGEHDAAGVGEQHVARLDVAVEDALGVGGAQRAEQVDADLRDEPGRQRALLLDDLLEGAALDQLHDDPGKAVHHDGVVHGGDRGMVEARGEARLTDHAFAQLGLLLGGEPRVPADLFHRHLAPERPVPGTPDRAHGSSAEGGRQLVAVGEQPRVLFRHEYEDSPPRLSRAFRSLAQARGQEPAGDYGPY